VCVCVNVCVGTHVRMRARTRSRGMCYAQYAAFYLCADKFFCSMCLCACVFVFACVRSCVFAHVRRSVLVCQHLACSADEDDKGVVSVALLLLRCYPFLFDASNLCLQIPFKSDFSQAYLCCTDSVQIRFFTRILALLSVPTRTTDRQTQRHA